MSWLIRGPRSVLHNADASAFSLIVDNHPQGCVLLSGIPKEITRPSEFLIMANQTAEQETAPVSAEGSKPKYPGIPVTCNNQLTQWVETRITEGGVFYPITPSTRVANLSAGLCARRTGCVGQPETGRGNRGPVRRAGWSHRGGHDRQAYGKLYVWPGIVYAMEQYYHAPASSRRWFWKWAPRAHGTRQRALDTMIFMPPWTQAGRC